MIKYITIFFLCLGLLGSLPHAARADTPHKYALLIGIHEYEHGENSIFPNLNTETDVAAIRSVLLSKFSFQPADITVLSTKAETTRASILGALRALINKTKAGDIVYIHYSGHGSQVPDPKKASGLDSTIVPSDWAQDGSMDIRDTTIAGVLNELSTHNPANVTLTFDCCHSGSITRGGRMLVRGVSYEKRYGQKPPFAGTSMANLGDTGASDSFSPVKATRGKAVPKFVVISACADNQSAVETEDAQGNPMGRLSYLLSTTMQEAGPQTTYQDLFDKISSEMRQKFADDPQDPQIDGERDKLLLDGTAAPPQTYTAVQVDADGTAHLESGAVLGVTVQSEYAIYPNGTSTFTEANQIASATVSHAGAIESTLQVTPKPGAKYTVAMLNGARAVETKHFYGDQRLKVQTADFDALPQKDSILSAIRALPSVNTDLSAGEAPDVLLETAVAGPTLPGGAKPGDLVLRRADGGSVIRTFAPTDDLATEISSALSQESKWRSIGALQNDKPGLPVSITLKVIPALPPADPDDGTYHGDLAGLSGGPLTLHDGDWVTLTVTNTGSQDAYVTILDLTSDGKVHQLWPLVGQGIQDNPDNFISAHQTRRLWIKSDITNTAMVQLSPPFGRETFKAIVTDKHVDFQKLLDGQRGAADDSPLGQMLSAASGGTRAHIPVPPADWATAAVAIDLKPKE